MYQFLKSHLLFMICFLVILIGCTNRKISREFSHTMEDGGRVNIKMEYKPKSQISGDEKFGSYYYIVQHFAPKPSPPAKTEGQEDKTKTKDALEEWLQNRTPREQRGILQFKQTRYIEISFYDRKGYLIGRKFSPGWNHDEDEENRIDGG